MYAIHSAEIAGWISVEHSQAGLVPGTSQMNLQAIVGRESVSDPLSAAAILHDDDDAAAIVEIPHGDPVALTGATADGFDDKRVFPGVRRSWDAYEQGNLGDRVRDTHDRLRNSHLIALRVTELLPNKPTRLAVMGVNSTSANIGDLTNSVTPVFDFKVVE